MLHVSSKKRLLICALLRSLAMNDPYRAAASSVMTEFRGLFKKGNPGCLLLSWLD